MPTTLEVLFTPAEFAALAQRDLLRTTCVVFDIFRATSTIVTALANGAQAVIPVAEIPDALAVRHARSEVLLAGERDGQRISARLTNGVEFDLGNSPLEFTSARITGKTVVISTTNGSRALRACAKAKAVLIGSFLNLRATADYLALQGATEVLLVCSGTGDQAAYEDILGAGALAELLKHAPETVADSVTIALQIYQQHAGDLSKAVAHCRNGRRLLTIPELRDDVAYCLQRDVYPLVAELTGGTITRIA